MPKAENQGTVNQEPVNQEPVNQEPVNQEPVNQEPCDTTVHSGCLCKNSIHECKGCCDDASDTMMCEQACDSKFQ